MMTYRYCQLAVGRNLPVRSDGISWKDIELVAPCYEDGSLIHTASNEEMKLWNKHVIGFEVKGKTLYVRLRGVANEDD